MALSWQELVELSNNTEVTQKEDVTVPLKEETTLGDYFLDVVRAPVGGATRAIQGLIQLGSLPVDYLADTNLTSKIDELFNKWTPDAKTGVGELVQTLVQFGLPLGVASKVGSGIKILKGATKVNKLSGIPTIGGKVGELSRRAGYFGALGGVTDIAASVTGRDRPISETFGFSEETDLEGLSGRERAAEALKQKFKFGAEGTVISGGITLLPVAGTVGAKLLGPAYGKVIAPIGGKVLRTVDSAVVNPLSKMIAGVGEQGSLASRVIRKGGDMLDVATNKLGIPSLKEWKFFDPEGPIGQAVYKKLDSIKNNLTSSGIISPTLKAESDKITGLISSAVKRIGKIDRRINTTLENIVSKFKVNVFDDLTKSPQYHNIQDAIQSEKNKIFDYIKASTKSEQARTLKLIKPEVQAEAKELKNILKESNTLYGNLLAKSELDKHKAFSGILLDNADNYLKQRFASFNNAKFKFDVNGEVAKGALKELKKISLLDIGVRKEIAKKFTSLANLKQTDAIDLFNKIQRNEPLTDLEKRMSKDLDSAAVNRLEIMKRAIISSGDDPTKFFGGISRILRQDYSKLKQGEEFPDAIKRFLSTPADRKVAIKDYTLPLLDAVTFNAKQVYKNRYFDLVEKEWLKNNLIFTSAEDAIAKGINPSRLQKITPRGEMGTIPTDPMFESNLFKKEYLTLPEIANAVQGVKSTFDKFFSNPYYNGMMQIKAAGQIAKTIFSPMTQIRNVTTASFFPLASGLIGGRASLADSWKLVADDIFQGAKVDLAKLNAEIDDLVTRGVIDQNIQINEIKNILDQANKGKLSFNAFMGNPTVQKLVDIYQGGDNIWKIYADRFYRSALTEAFGNPNAVPDEVLKNVKDWYRTVAKEDFIENNILTGQKKTAEEALKDVSAYLVTNTIPTYSKVPKLIQELRKLPLGNFIAFPAEIIRTGSNLLTIGARELTSSNPFIRQMGARRLIGASATFGGIGTVVQKSAEYFTGVDEQTMDNAKRSFIPIYEKNSTLIPLSKPDENGSFKYFNFSYSNPYDTLVRPINAVVNAYGNGQLNKDTADAIVYSALFGDARTPGAIGELLSPFISESIGTERIADLAFRNGETRSGRKIFYPEDKLQVKIVRGLEHIIGGIEPGAYTQAKRVWQGATGTFTDAGTARNTRDELVAIMSGIRVQEVKPLTSMPFIITSFSKDGQNINSKFSRTAYSANTSPEQKIAAFKENIIDSFTSQKRLYQTIQDAEELGVSRTEIRGILEDRLKNKQQVNNLLRGVFKAPNYSKARFESTFKRLESENDIAAEIYKENAKTVMDIYEDMQRESKGFDLTSPISEIDSLIEESLGPSLPEIRELPLRPRAQIEPATQQPNLPTGITGQSVNQQVLSPGQNLGQQYNLLSSAEKLQRFRDAGL